MPSFPRRQKVERTRWGWPWLRFPPACRIPSGAVPSRRCAVGTGACPTPGGPETSTIANNRKASALTPCPRPSPQGPPGRNRSRLSKTPLLALHVSPDDAPHVRVDHRKAGAKWSVLSRAYEPNFIELPGLFVSVRLSLRILWPWPGNIFFGKAHRSVTSSVGFPVRAYSFARAFMFRKSAAISRRLAVASIV
jgi:hypothetical protein